MIEIGVGSGAVSITTSRYIREVSKGRSCPKKRGAQKNAKVSRVRED